MIVTVSHYTYGWIQHGLTSLFRYVPDVPVLVIDNNPSVDDSCHRAKSFQYPYLRNTAWARHFCEAERAWLESQPNVILQRTPHWLQHGAALDQANLWAHDHFVRYLVHIDPDCECYGRKWLDNLLIAMTQGNWLAAGGRYANGCLHLIPAIWNVSEALSTSFLGRHMTQADRREPEFHKNIDPTKGSAYWDVGQYFWYKCLKLGKETYVPTPEYHHFWGGSRRPHKSAFLIL